MRKNRIILFKIASLISLTLGLVFGFKLTQVHAAAAAPQVSYRTHVQNVGWQAYVKDGATSGTSGRSLRLEGINIRVSGMSGGIEYQTHVQNVGWQAWKKNDQMSGTSGRSLRLEGIKIRLTGEIAKYYDVYYRTHVQNVGWQDWKVNGAMSGTSGLSLRLEGIQIKLEPKPQTKTGDRLTYSTHIQNYGWQQAAGEGQSSGSWGKALRLEAIKINVAPELKGQIEYSTHVQSIGWQSYVKSGQMSGTSGKSLRLEGIKIRWQQNAPAAKQYDIVYRTHIEGIGWQNWVKNDAMSGTMGQSKRLEAIEIKLVDRIPVSQVTAKVDKMTVPIGGTAQITATVLPSNATNKAVTYSSSDSTVATVDSTGKVTAKKAGTATMTVKTADGGKTATVKVTVIVPVTSVSLTTSATSLTVGKTAQLTATVAPSNATNKSVTYTSSDTTFATVDSAGKVTAKKAGTATMTVKTVDGGKTATVKVTVIVPVTSVSLTTSATSLTVGKTAQLTATVAPSNATNKSVTYSSSDSTVATVDSTGKVTAKKAGTATMTVKTADGGKTATINLTVTPIYVTGITAKLDKSNVIVGEVAQITTTVLPGNATNKAVTYNSSNPAIAIVDVNGKVTAKAVGTVNLTAKTVDGNKTAVVTLTVNPYRSFVASVQELRNKYGIILKADDPNKVNPSLLSQNVDAVNQFYNGNPQFKQLDMTKLDEINMTKLPTNVGGVVTTSYYVSNHQIVSMKMELNTDYYYTAVGNEGDDWQFGLNHVFIHEFGHVIQRLMEDKIRQGGVDFRLLKQVLNSKANAKITDAQSMINWWRNNGQLIAQNVTSYGSQLSYGKNPLTGVTEAYPAETFAELFAESFTQTNLRPWAKVYQPLLADYMTEITKTNRLVQEQNPEDDEIVTVVWEMNK